MNDVGGRVTEKKKCIGGYAVHFSFVRSHCFRFTKQWTLGQKKVNVVLTYLFLHYIYCHPFIFYTYIPRLKFLYL